MKTFALMVSETADCEQLVVQIYAQQLYLELEPAEIFTWKFCVCSRYGCFIKSFILCTILDYYHSPFWYFIPVGGELEQAGVFI